MLFKLLILAIKYWGLQKYPILDLKHSDMAVECMAFMTLSVSRHRVFCGFSIILPHAVSDAAHTSAPGDD